MSEPGGMIDRLTPVYAKHLTHDDIKQLLVFYRTDLGKKIINRMPVVTSESMAVGQQWGAGLAPDFQSIVGRTLAEDKVVLKQSNAGWRPRQGLGLGIAATAVTLDARKGDRRSQTSWANASGSAKMGEALQRPPVLRLMSAV